MNTFVHHLPDSVTQGQLEAALQHVCADVRVDGVLIQLPLPRHLSEEAVMEVGWGGGGGGSGSPRRSRGVSAKRQREIGKSRPAESEDSGCNGQQERTQCVPSDTYRVGSLLGLRLSAASRWKTRR